MLVRRLTESHILKIEIDMDRIMSMFTNGRELWWGGWPWSVCLEEIKGHLTQAGRVVAEAQIKAHLKAEILG